MFGCYASIGDLKGILGITSTTDDVVMRKILEAASRSIDSYTNRTFATQTATKYFDGACTLWLPDLLSITTLKTDEDGDATFENTFDTTDYLLYGTGLEDSLNTYPKTRLEINSNTGDYGSFASGVQKGVQIAGVWGYGDGISATPYVSDTTTSEALDASETGVDVTSATNLSAGQLILVESEQMYIYSISSTTLTVERGVNGTTAATHDTAKTIYIYQYPSDIRQACIDLSVATYQNRSKQGLQSERLGDYCLSTTAEALTMNGWRNASTLKTSDKILAYNPETEELEWADVLNIHKSQYKGKMLQLKSRKGIDTLASPNHRWYVKPLFNTAKWKQRIHTSEELNTWDRIPLSAPFNNKAEKIFSDDFVECVGWFVTEGNYQPDRNSKRYAAFINQSDKHSDYCDSIRKCLNNLLDEPVAGHNHGNGNVGFYIPAQTKLLKDLYTIVPNKQLTMSFITQLTNEQLHLLWETMLKGDGDNGRYRFYQQHNETMDTFQVLAVLCGFGTRLSKKDIHKSDDEAVYSLSCLKPIRGVRDINKGWIDYDGEIWCPETSLGTWVARDNGSTFITGNSYTIAGTSLGKSMVESILESIRPYKRMRF